MSRVCWEVALTPFHIQSVVIIHSADLPVLPESSQTSWLASPAPWYRLLPCWGSASGRVRSQPHPVNDARQPPPGNNKCRKYSDADNYILLYVALYTIMAISRQKKELEVGIMSYT